MRILHIDTSRAMRGGQHQILLLLEGLKKLGHSQTLLARDPLLGQWPGQAVGFASLWKSAKEADLIHAHDSHAHTLATLACPRKPLVVSRRVAFEIRRGVLSHLKYSRVDRFLAVSKHVANELSKANIALSKVEVIYDGVAVPPHSSISKRQPCHVVGLSSDDPLKENALLQKSIDQVNFSLHLSSNLVTDLRSASVFVYLSRCEGLGSAILLAMALKVPVIASRVGGIPELVEHERTGLLVKNEVDDITNALKRFECDPTLANECTERAYQYFLERFTSDIMVRHTEQAYREVLTLRTPS